MTECASIDAVHTILTRAHELLVLLQLIHEHAIWSHVMTKISESVGDSNFVGADLLASNEGHSLLGNVARGYLNVFHSQLLPYHQDALSRLQVMALTVHHRCPCIFPNEVFGFVFLEFSPSRSSPSCANTDSSAITTRTIHCFLQFESSRPKAMNK